MQSYAPQASAAILFQLAIYSRPFGPHEEGQIRVYFSRALERSPGMQADNNFGNKLAAMLSCRDMQQHGHLEMAEVSRVGNKGELHAVGK